MIQSSSKKSQCLSSNFHTHENSLLTRSPDSSKYINDVNENSMYLKTGQMIRLVLEDAETLKIIDSCELGKQYILQEQNISLRDLIVSTDLYQFNIDSSCLKYPETNGILCNPCRIVLKNGFHAFFHVSFVKEKDKLVAFLYNKFSCSLIEDAVKKRSQLLRVASNVARTLLTNQNFNDAISQALSILGEATSVDRIRIFKNHYLETEDVYTMNLRFEWTTQNAEAKLGNPELQNIPYENGLKEWHNILSKGETLRGLVKDMSDSVRQVLEHHKIKSILVVPIKLENHFWGFIGFDDCENEHIWTDCEEAILESVAANLGGAIEKERASKELENSKAQYQSVVENIEEVVFQTNTEGQCTYINNAWQTITGHSVESTLGKNIFEYFDNEKFSFLNDFHKSIIEGKKKRLHREFGLHIKLEHTCWVSLTLLPNVDENGNIIGVFGTMMDATKEKNAMDSILASEKKYRKLSNLISDYVYKIKISKEGELQFEWVLTGGFYNILGYNQKEIDEIGWLSLMSEENKEKLSDRLELLMKGEKVRTELPITSKSGETVWVEDTAYPQMNENADNLEEIICIVRNITDQKKAEKAIQKSQEALSEAHIIAKLGNWELDIKNQIITVSKEHQLFVKGQAIEETMSLKEFGELYIDDADLPVIQERLGYAIQHNSSDYKDSFYYRLKNKENGVVKHVHVLAQYKSEEFIKGISQDITQQKRAEELILQSKEKYKTIFNSIQDVYAEVDVNGIILEISPSILNLSGFSREMLIGKAISDFYADQKDRVKLLEELYAKEKLSDYEVKLRHRDGSVRTCSFNVKLIKDENGLPFKTVGTMRDITERKKTEAQIQENEQKYRVLANNAVDLIWQSDLKLTFTYASPSVEAVTGYTVEEFVGTKFSQHIDSFKELMKIGREAAKAVKTYKTFKSVTFESNIKLKSGKVIPIEITSRLLLNEKETPVGLQGTIKDISERKKSEEILRLQEARTRAINQAIPDYLIEVDNNGLYLNTNYKTHDFHANDSHVICDSKFIGTNINETKPIELREKLIPAFEKAKQTGELQVFESNVSNNKSDLFVEVRIVPTEMKRLLIIIRDITDRMAYQTKLNEQLHFFQQLIDSIPNPLYYRDYNGVYMGCNKEFERYLGLDREKIIGKTVYDVQPLSKAKFHDDMDQLLFENQDKPQVYETIVTSANGYEHEIMYHKATFYDVNNKLLGLIGSMLDITDLKKMERQLLNQKQFFQQVIDTDPNFVLVLNKNDQVKLINQSAADFLGLPKELFLDNSMGKNDMFSENIQKLITHDENLLSSQSSEINVMHLKNLHNQEREFSVIKKPLKIHNGEICELKISTDITNIKQKQNELHKTLKDLEKANQELKDFAYIVSHDLKAPLRAIGSLSNWLYTDYADILDEDGKENLELLVGRVKRMHDLIEGILQYSRIGRVKEDVKLINLEESMQEIVEFLAVPKHFNVSIETSMPIILAEQTRVMQVFQNLISNAVKYNDKDLGEIKIGCIDNEDSWKIYVKDNGPGIDPKYYEKIFQIFQTLSPRDEKESTGIGLTIVKKIIENYGGSISVESEPNAGTTFWITLPKTINIAA